MPHQAALKAGRESADRWHDHRRLREGLFITALAVALFCLVSLFSYHSSDPGWSNTLVVKQVANAGGRVGAYFADIFLYFFGYLAYVFPIALLHYAWLFMRREEADDFDMQHFVMRSVGLVLLLISGCGIASFRMPVIEGVLPFTAGGILGDVIKAVLVGSFNVLGSCLLLFAMMLSAVTLFTGISWLRLMEVTGRWTLEGFATLWTMVTQRVADRRDRAPRPVIKPVEKKVKPRKPKAQRIKPVIAPQAQTVKTSARYDKERQKPLFKGMDDGSMPALSLLDPIPEKSKQGYSDAKLELMSREVEQRLCDFGIEVQVVAVHPGPVITRFEMQLAPGVKVSRITGLAKDLARSLSVTSVRIVEVIAGKSVVGLELPNEHREMVRLSEILSSKAYDQAKSPLSMALGKDIAGHPVIVDLAKMPHLLVAGTTGSGKSVGLNAMLLSLLFKATPDEVRMILIDPKMLELSIYDDIPHLLSPVVTDMNQAAHALRWCVAEMERRYRLMSAMGVRNLKGFNTKIKDAIKAGRDIPDPLWTPGEDEQAPMLEPLPHIVVVIDELADMMMVVGKKVEQLIARIAQKARAAGIHMILATQRPSVDVLTGLIKSNIPTRIGFQVSSKVDSRTILDQGGAEQLLGHGDMLYLPPGNAVPVRVHGAFVDDHEVHRVTDDWKARSVPDYIESITDSSNAEAGDFSFMGESAAGGDTEDADPLYDEVVQFVCQTRKASISSVQRKFKVGYNRAARLIEELERTGVVGPMEGNGAREVLAPGGADD